MSWTISRYYPVIHGGMKIALKTKIPTKIPNGISPNRIE
jgi:hypothetical protein